MRLRIKFTKLSPLNYIGHLDLMRYFQKVLRRANIPVKYSNGYNPHIEMSFALPLGVGTFSIGDYLDVDLDESEVEWIEKQYLTEKEISNFLFDKDKISMSLLSDILKNINNQSRPECYVRGINVVPSNKKNNAMTLLAYCDYIVSIPYNTTDIFERDALLTSIEEYLNGKIVINKKTKSGFKDIDFTNSLIEYRLANVLKLDNNEYYHYFKFMDNESSHEVFKDDYINKTIDEYFENLIAKEEIGNLIIFLRCKSGSQDNLNPTLLFNQYYESMKINVPLIHIYRIEMYDKNKRRLIDTAII